MTNEGERSAEAELKMLTDMMGFLRYAANGHANVASLHGPIDVPTVFHTFIGLFPDGPFAAVSTNPGVDKKTLYERVLALEIPGRVLAVEDLDDQSLRRAHEALLAVRGLPSIVLALGETQDTQKETVYLATAKGIIPGTGLAEIQEAVRARSFT